MNSFRKIIGRSCCSINIFPFSDWTSHTMMILLVPSIQVWRRCQEWMNLQVRIGSSCQGCFITMAIPGPGPRVLEDHWQNSWSEFFIPSLSLLSRVPFSTRVSSHFIFFIFFLYFSIDPLTPSVPELPNLSFNILHQFFHSRLSPGSAESWPLEPALAQRSSEQVGKRCAE